MGGDNDIKPQTVLVPSNESSKLVSRIVSPLAAQFANLDIRQTLAASDVIRLQQHDLITSSNKDKKPPSSTSTGSLDYPFNSPASSSNTDPSPLGSSVAKKSKAQPATAATAVSPIREQTSNLSTVSSKPPLEIVTDTTPKETTIVDDESVTLSNEEEIQRMAEVFSLKRLKRNFAPKPLRISSRHLQQRLSPVINSAPMRPVFAQYPVSRMPVRYVYPAVPSMPVMPHPYQYTYTPVKRTRQATTDRSVRQKLPRNSQAFRKKPVLDVFQNEATRVAPMPSQPPSAHREHFEDISRSPERHSRLSSDASATLQGNISFNDESTFNFKIFKANDEAAKQKFIKICETTWDTYFSNSVQ